MALKPSNSSQSVGLCPVCEGEPRVLVVLAHPVMLRFPRDLLEREAGCWVATEAHSGPALARALDEFALSGWCSTAPGSRPAVSPGLHTSPVNDPSLLLDPVP